MTDSFRGRMYVQRFFLLLACLIAGLSSAELSPAQRAELEWIEQQQLACEDAWVVRADVARLIRLAELGDGIGARARVVVAAGYRRLLAGAAGAPSRAESAYCTYALAVCRAMDGAWPEARTLLAAFDGDFARTPSQPRALYFRLKTLMGAATISAADEEVCRTDLARLLKDNADTHEADAALHCMAWVLASRGRLVEARGYFQDYVRRYPDGLWGAAAKTELAEVVAAIAAAPTEER